MLTQILHISSSIGNVTYMFLSTILVFIMTPGLAFFYGELVQKKNSLTIMLQISLAIGVVGLLWIFGGFSMVLGKDIGEALEILLNSLLFIIYFFILIVIIVHLSHLLCSLCTN